MQTTAARSTVSGRVPRMAPVEVVEGEDTVVPVAGVVLWGALLDRLDLGGVADERQLRAAGPQGYSGGTCYRALAETMLAGGDFVSDRFLLADVATAELRGQHALPSVPTLTRFLAEAGLGTVAKAAAVNREMLRRAWAMGAGPHPGLLTIDVDPTMVPTYGSTKEGTAFSYTGQVGLAPMLGVLAETGDVLAVRARGPRAGMRGLASFLDECICALPDEVRATRQLWFRADSQAFSLALVRAARRHDACFTVTARQVPNVVARITELQGDPGIIWFPAIDSDDEVAESTIVFGATARRKDRGPGISTAGVTLRLIVRRQRVGIGQQLSFDDLDGYRFQAVMTNIPPLLASAAQVEHHHRLRGGGPEEVIRQLKGDFGFAHAPVKGFFGNWLWWCASVLAYNVGRWLRVLALPPAFRRCRGKRLRMCFLNVAARLVHSGRRLRLRLPRAYPYAQDFVAAIDRIRGLPDVC